MLNKFSQLEYKVNDDDDDDDDDDDNNTSILWQVQFSE